jgi:glycosyltransferase involved in cell wall biosynthesis
MRIGVNTALVGPAGDFRRTGVSRYVSELLDALPDALGPEDALVRLGEGGRWTGGAAGRIAWEQTGLPWRARAEHLDLVHSPVNIVPLAWSGPSVVTVHDLAFLRYPEHVTRRRRLWLTAAIRTSVRRADHVIAVSSSTADDLTAWAGTPTDRITVVPSAPSPRIRPVIGEDLESFRRHHAPRAPYVLAVGTLEPRKNLPTLLRAFGKIRGSVPHDLVVVGPEGWLTGELQRTITDLDLGGRLRMTGFVSDAELGGWYSGADLFAFPSFYEGFGLPAVEAMRCGAPVLASDSSCFPEVVGDAGVLIPPDDVRVWAETMADLLGDPARREHLTRLGHERAAGYSWARTARETCAAYRAVG